jgi:hypothetical protein
MIANEQPPQSSIGTPEAALLNADAFHHAIVNFIEHQLPLWRNRTDRPPVNDESRLNETLCDHLDCAARHSFDSIRFTHEPYQAPGRAADIAVKPGKQIIVGGMGYSVFEQLLPIECKRLPTPPDKRRSDCEYVHGLASHHTGAIERFKHGLHGPTNRHAMIIAYVQEGSFDHWQTTINQRLQQHADENVDDGLWKPAELLSTKTTRNPIYCKLSSDHRRLQPPSSSPQVQFDHIWLLMN